MSFERRICAQTQDLQIFKKFNMSQMNPKEAFNNTAYSVQLPYIAGLPLKALNFIMFFAKFKSNRIPVLALGDF